jgi:hypothetical protein
VLVLFPKIVQYNKDYVFKDRVLIQRCNMLDVLFNPSVTLRFKF